MSSAFTSGHAGGHAGTTSHLSVLDATPVEQEHRRKHSKTSCIEAAKRRAPLRVCEFGRHRHRVPATGPRDEPLPDFPKAFMAPEEGTCEAPAPSETVEMAEAQLALLPCGASVISHTCHFRPAHLDEGSGSFSQEPSASRVRQRCRQSFDAWLPT